MPGFDLAGMFGQGNTIIPSSTATSGGTTGAVSFATGSFGKPSTGESLSGTVLPMAVAGLLILLFLRMSR